MTNLQFRILAAVAFVLAPPGLYHAIKWWMPFAFGADAIHGEVLGASVAIVVAIGCFFAAGMGKDVLP